MHATCVDELIGMTPLIRLNCISSAASGIEIYGKLESVNPGSSVKDRSALHMIERARAEHTLREGATIVESSSGNMGHALAMLCAAYKYRFICVLDPKTPHSNVTLVKAFGGVVEMVTVPDDNGSFQKKRIARAKAIAQEIPNCVNLDQYSNPAAIQAHFLSTGPEIHAQSGGAIDVLIGAASTGSHLSGTAKYLKSVNPAIHVIGVEPMGSVVFGGEFKPFLQNGIGLSFKPDNILMRYIDEVVKVSDFDAFAACRRIARSEGLLLGGSSGSVIHAAQCHVSQLRTARKVVVILPDGGLKYLDTIYDDQWLIDHNLFTRPLGEAMPAAMHSAEALARLAEAAAPLQWRRAIPPSSNQAENATMNEIRRVHGKDIEYTMDLAGMAGAQVRYRWQAGVDDTLAAGIVKLMRATSAAAPIIGFGKTIDDGEAVAYIGELRENLRAEKCRLLAIYAGHEQLIGLCTLKRNLNPNNRHITDLAKGMIDERYRGAGVLPAAFYEIATQCERDGVELLTLDVRAETPAHGAWLRFGFESYGMLPDYARAGGQVFAGHFMMQPVSALKARAAAIWRAKAGLPPAAAQGRATHE